MTALPLSLEAPILSGDGGHFETMSTKVVALLFDVFRIVGNAHVDAAILPSRSVVGLGLRMSRLYQP